MPSAAVGGDTLSIIVNELPPGLNGPRGLKRMHWAAYCQVRDRWAHLIREQSPPDISFQGPVIITYTSCSTRLMDWDNCCASFKVIGDALVSAGIIPDDNPQIIQFFIPHQAKVKKGEEKVIIEIQQIPPAANANSPPPQMTHNDP